MQTPDSMQVTVNSSKQAVTIAVKEDTDELDTIKLCNDELNSNVDNLINLPHLHEPALLYCLQQRYHVGDIYTYTGPILIAVNPFKRLDIYGPDELSSYYNSGLLKAQGIEMPNASPPHVFAIADAAYRGMMAAIESETELGGGLAIQSGHQSILISGESGAGGCRIVDCVTVHVLTVNILQARLNPQRSC